MTKPIALTALMLGVCFLGASALLSVEPQSASQSPQSQACSDDEGVVNSVKQDLSTLVDTVKKESQQDFDAKYHQQTCQSRLSICLEMTSQLVDCLTKASKDSSTPKEQLTAIQTMLATYTKLKNTLDQDIQALKGAKDTKAAKALIADFDFAH